jgi:hypothetical protein
MLNEQKIIKMVYRGRSGVAPLFLNLGSTSRGVVNFTPRPLYLQERMPVPDECRPGRLQSRSEHFGVEKNLLPLQGFEVRTVQPVA